MTDDELSKLAAANRLAEQNMGLAYKAAKLYRWTGIDDEELESYGMQALVESCRTWEPEKGALSTWVMVRMRTLVNWHHAAKTAARRGGAEATETLHRRSRDGTEYDITRDHRERRVGEAMEQAELARAATAHLSDGDRALLEMRFSKGMDLREIGNVLGVSPQRVNQRIDAVLKGCRLRISSDGNLNPYGLTFPDDVPDVPEPVMENGEPETPAPSSVVESSVVSTAEFDVSELKSEAEVLAGPRPSNIRPIVDIDSGHTYPTASTLAKELKVYVGMVCRACKTSTPIGTRRFRYATPAEAHTYVSTHWPMPELPSAVNFAGPDAKRPYRCREIEGRFTAKEAAATAGVSVAWINQAVAADFPVGKARLHFWRDDEHADNELTEAQEQRHPVSAQRNNGTKLSPRSGGRPRMLVELVGSSGPPMTVVEAAELAGVGMYAVHSGIKRERPVGKGKMMFRRHGSAAPDDAPAPPAPPAVPLDVVGLLDEMTSLRVKLTEQMEAELTAVRQRYQEKLNAVSVVERMLKE